MGCELWGDKLDAYVDGELPANEDQAVRQHLRSCATCAAESVEHLRLKRAVHLAGMRYNPDPAFRARIIKSITPAKPQRSRWTWLMPLAAVAAVVIVAALWLQRAQDAREQHLVSELIDLHVATLASANPVDVISTDRHTVKPWFAGRLPFTFNVPELQGSPFTLVGGRVSFLNQSAGAELIFRIRQHQISAFIFQARSLDADCAKQADATTLEFHVRSWSKGGLCYFVMGDASADDVNNLSALIKSAG